MRSPWLRSNQILEFQFRRLSSSSATFRLRCPGRILLDSIRRAVDAAEARKALQAKLEDAQAAFAELCREETELELLVEKLPVRLSKARATLAKVPNARTAHHRSRITLNRSHLVS